MDKLYAQLIREMPLIEKIESMETHFINEEALYLIDECSPIEMTILKNHRCLMKVFTEDKNTLAGIYKFQSIHKIIKELEISSKSWIFVVGYQIEKLYFDALIENTKKFSQSRYILDLTLSEASNFNLYNFKCALENHLPFDFKFEKNEEPIRMLSSIKDYANPPLDLFQSLFNKLSSNHELIIFTDSIKNPVDLYVLNQSKSIYIISPQANATTTRYKEQIDSCHSTKIKAEVLTPEDFIQKIRLRRI